MTHVVTAAVWKAALIVGNLSGCRPSPSIDHVARSIEQHDGVAIDGESWPFYLWPSIWHVDDEYAVCLERALAQLDQILARIVASEEAKSASFWTLSALDDVQKTKLETLRQWMGGGGFNVGALGTGEHIVMVLSRP